MYIHGQGGSKEEAEDFGRIAATKNWQVLSIDLPEHGSEKAKEIYLILGQLCPSLGLCWLT